MRVQSRGTDLRAQKMYGDVEQVHICIYRTHRAETGQMSQVSHWPHQPGRQPRCQQIGRVKNIAERPPRTRGQHRVQHPGQPPSPIAPDLFMRGWGGPRGGTRREQVIVQAGQAGLGLNIYSKEAEQL